MTIGRHMEIARAAGHSPELLQRRKPLPVRTAHVWGWFKKLSEGRQYTEAGPQPIPFTEIESWARLNRVDLRPCEVHLLKVLDVLYLTRGT